MALDKVGNCYVFGNTVINFEFFNVLIKYNSLGAAVWTKNFQNAGHRGVIADSIGNVYITFHFGVKFNFDIAI